MSEIEESGLLEGSEAAGASAEPAVDEAGEAALAETGPDVPAAPGELTEAQLEALLFVAEKALTRNEIAQVAGVDRETVDARIGDLSVTLAERGIRLVESGEKVELATAPESGHLIARYVGADAPKLSMPSLETLAIIAYRQPCTRATIERIRGVDTEYTLRVLLHRRLIVEIGRSEAPGRPFLYGTAFEFLERFGLSSLEDLPPLEPEIAERLYSVADEGDVIADTDAAAHPGDAGRAGAE